MAEINFKKIDKIAFSERLKKLLNEKNETIYTIAELTHLSVATISRYINGLMAPKITTIQVISNHFGVSPAWLLGYDVPRNDEQSGGQSEMIKTGLDTTPTMRKIPLLGNIACGIPILTEENIEDYVDMPECIHADFSLRCKGDSMINARIFDGDIVYIRKQPTVENGQIAAVLVEGIECEATLKKVYLNQDSIRLCAANPTFKDLVYYQEEMNRVRIIGRAVAFTSTIK